MAFEGITDSAAIAAVHLVRGPVRFLAHCAKNLLAPTAPSIIDAAKLAGILRAVSFAGEHRRHPERARAIDCDRAIT